MGKTGEAVSQLRQALRLNPHSAEVRLRLAWVLATCADADVRDGAEALRLAEEAQTLAVGVQHFLVGNALAAAYAELGRFEDACQAASQSLDLARQAGLKQELKDIENRLSVYRARKPFRDTSTGSSGARAAQATDQET
jgi:Flp pilus assembly protein TadD